MKKCTALCSLFIILFFCSPVSALSPPQYTLWREINASFGASPLVKVDDIREIDDAHYEIDIHGATKDISSALVAVLTPSYNIGNIDVTVNVFNPDGSAAINPLADRKAVDADEIEGYIKKALRGNPYFDRTINRTADNMDSMIWLQFKKKIIQFWNDNLADYYGNNVHIAADVFQSLMHAEFETENITVALGFTTRRW